MTAEELAQINAEIAAEEGDFYIDDIDLCEVGAQSESESENEVTADVEGELEADIEGELEADIEGELEADIEGELEADVEGELEADVESELDSDVESELEAQPLKVVDGKNVSAQIDSYVEAYDHYEDL